MANGLRLVPVEAEVLAGNRQIRRYCQFLAAARSQQGAIVADAQPKAAIPVTAGRACRALANLPEQGKFASSSVASGMGLLHRHLMRIGQTSGIFTVRAG
jgi:hypothetical protein